jgi:hypothetical protein
MQRFLPAFFNYIDEYQPGALTREDFRGGPSDTRPGAGDQRYFPVQNSSHDGILPLLPLRCFPVM